MRWTPELDEFLERNSMHGAEWCARRISRITGRYVSTQAVARHGNRIGVSFRRYGYCTECGMPYTRLAKDGECAACHAERLRDGQRRMYEAALANDAEAGRQAGRLTDEYNALRQRRYRMRKDMGIS